MIAAFLIIFGLAVLFNGLIDLSSSFEEYAYSWGYKQRRWIFLTIFIGGLMMYIGSKLAGV